MKTVSIKNIIIGEKTPKICVPLMGSDDGAIISNLDIILDAAKEDKFEIIEFRGDYYEKLNDKAALSGILKKIQEKLDSIILLFTIRSEQEGGEKLAFRTPAINEINAFVIENRLADIVDVEYMSGEEECRKLVELASTNDVKIIMSNHDFKTTPPACEIVNRLVTMQEYGADIAKIAVMPEDKEHVIELLKASSDMKKNHPNTPVVAISMGKLGALTRVTGEIFGSAITFATIGEGSAPGQMSVKKVNDCIELISKYFV